MAKRVIETGFVPLAVGALLSVAAVAGAQTSATTPVEATMPATGSMTMGGPDAAAATPSGGALTGRPSVVIPLINQRPNVDGSLDDAMWRNAAHLDTFVQQRPRENTPATESTDIYIAYDEQNIYFGVHAHYSDVSSMRVNRSERDRVFRDDLVSIIFDPFMDQQRAYVFSVNGYGVQADSLMGGGGRGGGGPGGGGPGGGGGGMGGLGDRSWDALFSAAGHPVADGWTAEIAIPFKSLRYPAKKNGEAHRWGFQIQRDIQGKNESDVWSPVLRNEASFLGQMGTLDGMTNLSMSRNLELLPTFTAVRASTLNTTTGAMSSANTPDAGINVKYGVTSNVTIDFTANPDFSQIESDQPQITTNQRFPVFYPELRPFFLEGQEIFDISGPVTFVHTRTIVDPQYGTKLTGKVGKTTLGVMVANDEAPGKTDDLSDPLYGKKAQFLFGRARYDLYSESSLGMIVTDREIGDFFSRAGGLDGRFKIGRTHRLELLGLFSDQFSSDEDDFGAHSGHIYNVNFRREGRGLSYGGGTSGISPGFRNDSGFVRRTDYRDNFGSVSYRWYPETWIVNWGPRVGYSRAYDYAGVQQDDGREFNVSAQFARNINIGGGFSREMEHFEGIDFDKSRYSFNANINASRLISVNVFLNGGDGLYYNSEPALLGKERQMNINFNIRPISRLSSTLMINTNHLESPALKQTLVNVKIYRSVTSFQFSNRLTARTIIERNSESKKLGFNILGAYRINSGTAFFVGYDDHYKNANKINSTLFSTSELRRTNRAIFTKLQYLFRF